VLPGVFRMRFLRKRKNKVYSSEEERASDEHEEQKRIALEEESQDF